MVERKTLKNKFIGAMRHKEESEREKDCWMCGKSYLTQKSNEKQQKMCSRSDMLFKHHSTKVKMSSMQF